MTTPACSACKMDAFSLSPMEYFRMCYERLKEEESKETTVKFVKLCEKATIPNISTPGAAALDLTK